MAKQSTIKQAHEQGMLKLDKWAEEMIRRIRMNFDVQRIYPKGPDNGGPYKGYALINERRRMNGQPHSTGDAYKTIRKIVHEGAGGNTVAVDFFFKYYLFFVDWGVGRGVKAYDVSQTKKPSLKSRSPYAAWKWKGDRQRRPVVLGTIRNSRFYVGELLQQYWGREAELAVLYGLGYDKEKNEYVEVTGLD